jgi:hypothetical protein
MMWINSNLSGSSTRIRTAGLAMPVSGTFQEANVDENENPHVSSLVLAFAAGQRSCLGQQFALAESVCILAAIVRRYEILVPQDLQSLSREKKEKEMLDWYCRATVTPTGARVRLRRRD